MNDDHHVGEGDEPLGFPEADEDVIINLVAKRPISDERAVAGTGFEGWVLKKNT